MPNIMTMIKLQYNRLANKFEATYHQARTALSLDDTTETRTFLGVVSCVAIYYAIYIGVKLFALASGAAHTVIAIIQ